MRASLSTQGFELTRNIMRLNETLAELSRRSRLPRRVAVLHSRSMGKPSATEPWGWQLDGHHAIINYFVLGDQVVMTPLLHWFGTGEARRLGQSTKALRFCRRNRTMAWRC